METLKIPDKCLQCGEPYRRANTDLLSEGENTFVFHVTCPKCSSSAILKIIVGNEGVLSIANVTDAGKEDLDKLRQDRMISADDVIEAYMALKKN
jgi:hypothetical protein